MTIDQFTSALLLAGVAQTGVENGYTPMVKDIMSKKHNDKGPSQEVADLVTSWIGKKCTIKGTTYTAVVIRLNTAKGGLYPGGRYPVIVTIDNVPEHGKGAGYTFEYCLDQIEIKDSSCM